LWETGKFFYWVQLLYFLFEFYIIVLFLLWV
jgi:hypothetical protein